MWLGMRVLEGEGYWHPAELDRSSLKKKIQDKSTFHRGGQKEKVSSRFPWETNQTPWSVIFQDVTLESLLFAAQLTDGTEQTEMPGQQMCWCQADFPNAVVSPVLYDGSIISSLLASTASLLRRSVARTLFQFTFILGVLRISSIFWINSILSNVFTELYYVITFSSSCQANISNAGEVQILNFVFLRWYLWCCIKKVTDNIRFFWILYFVIIPKSSEFPVSKLSQKCMRNYDLWRACLCPDTFVWQPFFK